MKRIRRKSSYDEEEWKVRRTRNVNPRNLVDALRRYLKCEKDDSKEDNGRIGGGDGGRRERKARKWQCAFGVVVACGLCDKDSGLWWWVGVFLECGKPKRAISK